MPLNCRSSTLLEPPIPESNGPTAVRQARRDGRANLSVLRGILTEDLEEGHHLDELNPRP
jgi:hypothetical protein